MSSRVLRVLLGVAAVALLLPATAFARTGGQTLPEGAASLAGYVCTGPVQTLFDNTNILGVADNGAPPSFTVASPYCLTEIFTYHWNSGNGDTSPSATNSIETPSGGTVGTFAAAIQPASPSPAFPGGAPANWVSAVSDPASYVLNGTYVCDTSNRTTWSENTGAGSSNGFGFCRIRGEAATNDTTPPTVSISSPPGGSDLSGVQTITATASDDIGVQRVDFTFFNGATGLTTPIGSDSTAPYSIDFDTRTVPNCAHNNCTVYAQAFDLGGNASTQYGIGVGVFNGIVVDTTADDNVVNGNCTLREAIIAATTDTAVDRCANGISGSTTDSIRFTVNGTITLGSALPTITDRESIAGPGPANLTISGAGLYRPFDIASTGNLDIGNVTVSDGKATGANGGAFHVLDGSLFVEADVLTNNTAPQGGAIFNDGGTLRVEATTFSGNTSTGGGGAAVFNNLGTATLLTSTYQNNSASGDAGGIYNNSGTADITNNTFVGNTAAFSGGAVLGVAGTTTVTNDTIVGNSAAAGLGGGVRKNAAGGLTLMNSILSNNTSGGNCSGAINDGGGNFSFGDSTCPGTQTDPKLDPAGLASNGGMTQTIALLTGSPAIDSVTAGCPSTDQRYVSRPQGAACDAGAFEFVPPPDSTPPTATMSAPLDGASVSGLVWLGGNATDPGPGASGVATFSFQTASVDGRVPDPSSLAFSDIGLSGSGGGNVSASWGTEGSGDYYVRLKAVDVAGNAGFSTPVFVVVDNSNPAGVVKVDSPAIGGLDPLQPDVIGNQILESTCAKLYNSPDTSGQASLENLQPELATGPPTISADRKTWTFQVASGFKFSDGSDVTAQSLVRIFTRATDPANVTTTLGGIFSDVASATADGSTLTITLTHPDESLPAKLASSPGCAIPQSTPTAPQTNAPPGSGPYYVASYVPGKQLVLDRNPYYTGTRPSAFDRFVYTLGVSPAQAEDDVKNNVADYAAGRLNALPTADLPPLSDTYNSRFFRNPMLGLRYVVYNTQRSIFATAAARHNVSGVLDRSQLTGELSQAASVTDQLLPPGSPGFTDWSIYPSQVTDDTAVAAFLSAQGITPATLNLYAQTGTNWDAVVNTLTARFAHLGFTVNVVREPASVLFSSAPGGLLNPTTPFDVALFGWLADYPDPNDFLNALLEGPNDFSGFNDATELARLNAVDALPYGAGRYAEFRKLDLELSRDYAPMTAYANFDSIDFFSNRIGCQTYNPFFGMDLAALCLNFTPNVGTVTSSADGTVPAGAPATPTGAIDLGAVNGAEKAAGIDGIGIDGIGIDGIGIDGIDLKNSGIDGIGIDGIGIDGIGIDGIPFLQQNGLAGMPLTQIPLVPPDSWDQRLQGTALAGVPVVDLTLQDVFKSAPGVLHGLKLSQIDFSASPLANLPVAAVALGTVGIDGISIDGNAGAQNLTDWCTTIHALPGFATFDCSTLSGTTVMNLALKGIGIDGIGIDGIGIDGIGIDGIDLTNSPLKNVTLDSVKGNLASSGIDGIGIDGIGIDGIDFSKSPFAGIHLDAAGVHCNAVVVDPSFCAGHTLGDAFAAGKLKPGATIGDLGAYPGINLGNLGVGIGPKVTLGQLLSLLIPKVTDWSLLPSDFPLNEYATGGGTVAFHVPFGVTIPGGGSGSTAVKITATFSNGARYVPGSASVAGLTVDTTDVSTSGNVETVKWKVHNVPAGAPQTLSFTSRAGEVLGGDSVAVSVSTGGAPATAAPSSFTVGDTFEPNDTAAAATPIQSNTLYESYITSATARDYFTLPNPPAGSIVKAKLIRLPADYDLVMYAPQTQPLRSVGIDGIGIDGIGIDGIPAGDTTQTLQQRAQTLGTETLQDVPTDGGGSGQAVAGTSSTRGTAPEEIDYVSNGQPGNLTLQVTAFNGDFSPTQPYTLLVTVQQPPSLGPCTQTLPNPGAGTAGTIPTVGANVNTLILTNEKQLGDVYGAAGETTVVNAANSLVSAGYAGNAAVIPVEGDPGVAAAYANWNANACNPAAANDVVRAIGHLIDTLSAGRPIQNILILGNDRIVPMARLADPNEVANEANYAGTIGFGQNNALLAAAADHLVLSDDPYGDASPTPYNGGFTYVPSVGLSRVVETPAEIAAQVTQFNNAHGLLNPTTEAVTGYDFLTDGSQATSSALRAQGRTGSDLINETWTASQFDSLLFPGASPPAEVAANAHYDSSRLLPADQNAAHLSTNLYTTAQLVAHGAGSTNGRLVFTVGCHSGWNAPDTLFGGAFGLDWAQAYAQTGAAMFEGNTGFGYGDTVTVAYSEALQVDFAKRLDGTLNIGQALAFAKQDYWGALGPLFTNYDAKVMGEATEYGIGLYRLGTGTPPAAPAPPPTFTDAPTGLTATSFTFNPTFQSHATPTGTYYTVGGNAINVNRRPIEPVTYADVTEPGQTAHGASFVITSSSDTTPFDPAFDRIVAASGKSADEVVGLTTFPTDLVDVRTLDTPTGRQQKLAFVPAQFLSDNVPDAAGVGTQRLFNTSSVTVYYSPSHDFKGPDVGPITVDRVGSLVGFSADVVDTDPSGTTTPDVKRVFVNYLDGTTWRKIDLGRNGNHWSGAGPLSTNAASYFFEAIDKGGNVSVVSDKGQVAPAVAQTSSGSVTVTVTGPKNGDWYTGAATATFSAPVTFSLDGGALTNGTTVAVSGDGVHTLTYNASDGSHGTVIVPIDTTGPTIATTFHVYSIGSTGNVFDVTCSDAGSGVASCVTTPAAPDTSTVGVKSYSVVATDRVGNSATGTGSYQVVWPFRGFLSPIGNTPTLNVVTAGQAVPVKFSLSGNRGLSIMAAGYPTSRSISCATDAPLDTSVPTVTAGASSLSYDATSDTYTYTWKTDKSFTGCRELDVKLVDGSEHFARFKFK